MNKNLQDAKVVTQHKVSGGYLVTCELRQVLVAATLGENEAPWNAICYEFQSIDCMEESPAHAQPCYDLQLALEFAQRWVKGEITKEEIAEAEIRANAAKAPLSSDPTNVQF